MSPLNEVKDSNDLRIYALDPPGANVREDGFFCKVTQDGYKLIIAVVVPPIELLIDGAADKSLAALLNEKHLPKPDLFNKGDKIANCLKEGERRNVIAVKYFVTCEGGVKEEFVTPDIAQATWIDYERHNQIPLCKLAYAIIKIIHNSHDNGDILKRKIKRFEQFKDVNVDQQLSNLLLDSFSFSCRAFCKKLEIPYYHAAHRTREILVSSSNYGRFNRPMRDILALINLLNLHNHLTGKGDLIIKENDLSETLGRIHNIFLKKV